LFGGRCSINYHLLNFARASKLLSRATSISPVLGLYRQTCLPLITPFTAQKASPSIKFRSCVSLLNPRVLCKKTSWSLRDLGISNDILYTSDTGFLLLRLQLPDYCLPQENEACKLVINLYTTDHIRSDAILECVAIGGNCSKRRYIHTSVMILLFR